ncbi:MULTISPECIES: helix-turn-helix domain-containing protein [unclassified Neptuniibacter]|uniref:helix-turn-helix domain-containing protein n=1 Tax=unclassified Neptuniibacter TaxID=2630693 RepID=UPI0025E018A0|nr:MULTISPECIES: helix-turn-helix domain-containing protein [unclassified Neptuniibacter]|tara:strand:+ start:220 stop:615 length:396 start_codon:yes stop_codon:yes gene_type:complete
MSDQYLSITDRWMRQYEADNPHIKAKYARQSSHRAVEQFPISNHQSTAMQSDNPENACPWNDFESNSQQLDPLVESAIEVRKTLQLTQVKFSRRLGISVRTLRDWEQGRRHPCGAARTLLRCIAKHPDLIS